jgi:type III secretion system needle length determinant
VRAERLERTDRADSADRPQADPVVEPQPPVAEPEASRPVAEQQAAGGSEQQPQGEPTSIVIEALEPAVAAELVVVDATARPAVDPSVTASSTASAPVVGPQPAPSAVVDPAVLAKHVTGDQPVAQAGVISTPVAQATAAAVTAVAAPVAGDKPAAEAPGVAVPAQQQPAGPQQPAAAQQQSAGPQQPQADGAAARPVAAPVAPDAAQAGGEQQSGQQQSGERGDQPAANQPQQPAVAAAADAPHTSRAPLPAALSAVADKAGVTAPAATVPQPVQPTVRTEVPTRGVRLSQAADAVENAIRIGSTRGVTHARISLNPAELGGVEIHLQQTAQGLSASVVASGAEAAQVLQQAAQDLRRQLEAQGIELTRLDISYSGEQREGARSAQAGQGDGERRSPAGDGSAATDGGELTPTDEITVKSTIELPDGVLVDVLA